MPIAGVHCSRAVTLESSTATDRPRCWRSFGENGGTSNRRAREARTAHADHEDARSAGDGLHRRDLLFRQRRLYRSKILAHVLLVGCAGEDDHPDGQREREHELRNRRVVRGGDLENSRMRQLAYVCCQKRKTLIADAFARTHPPHLPIPTELRETAVLYERGLLMREIAKRLHLLRCDVAGADV